ncbi:MAG: quinolinate synthase NadA, partial [Pseudohongiellaceae bacterium]
MINITNTQELDNPTSDLEIVRRYLDQVKPPKELSKSESSKLEAQLRELMQTKNACLVAHYYSDSSLQDLADDTGGFVGDSLEMARFGRESDADILVVAGVRFMGETAKILSPNKKVLMPTLDATCSLDIACPIETFA